MTRYIARRVLYLVPVWLGISLLAFSLALLAPGDPVRQTLQASGIDAPSSEQVQAMRRELGLDQLLSVTGDDDDRGGAGREHGLDRPSQQRSAAGDVEHLREGTLHARPLAGSKHDGGERDGSRGDGGGCLCHGREL